MARSSTEILAPARTEIARGRPRAALKELETARAELLSAGDAAGLNEALELARGVSTLAPVDARSRERLLAALEQDIASLAQSGVVLPTPAAPSSAPASAPALYVSYASTLREQALAPARSEIGREETKRALRSLEKARRKLLDRSDVNGLGELLELAQRLPIAKPRHEKARGQLIEATRQNIRFLSRRNALGAGEEWSDPFASAAAPMPTSSRPSPPMTRREILIAACIVIAMAGVVTAWALASRAPQRVAHALKCPTGEEGSPTWSPDGKEIAFAKDGSCGTQITIVPADGGATRELTTGYGVLPNWSPDGRTILYRSKDGFSVVAVRSGEPRLIRSDDGAMGASWSPNGERIAFVHGLAPDPDLGGFHSTLYTMKPDGSGVRRILGHKCNPRTPVWSASGKYLVFACDDGVYTLRPTSKGSHVRLDSLEQLVDCDFSVRPISVSLTTDAKLLAFGWNGVETMELSGNHDPKTFVAVDDPEDATVDVAWSPDGRRLAFSVIDSGIDDGLYVIDRDGSHRRRLVKF